MDGGGWASKRAGASEQAGGVEQAAGGWGVSERQVGGRAAGG